MRALELEGTLHRFAAARVAATLGGPARGVGVGPLRLTELDAPALPGPDWRRVRPQLAGICGSDLAMLDGVSSRYFESIVSFPFVPGHEIVGVLEDGPGAGRRVVVEPALGCEARSIEPRCAACAAGRKGGCERIAFGHIRPGLQTGFCSDTGGGWSESLVVHVSQLHEVPDGLSDDDAVLVEPTACALHAALAARVEGGEHVVVLGAGTLGLVTLAALRRYCLPGSLLAVAKHPVQRDLAGKLGADLVVDPAEAARAVRRLTGSLALPPLSGLGPRDDDSGPPSGARATLAPTRLGAGAFLGRGSVLGGGTVGGGALRANGRIGRLTGGADCVLDCVGSAASIDQALAIVRPGGRIVLVGMPGITKVDLAPLWHREVSLTGAYAYGMEDRPEGPRSTFDLAFELVDAANLGQLVSARYPLGRYEEAVRHAATAGRRGGVKVVFDLRKDQRSMGER